MFLLRAVCAGFRMARSYALTISLGNIDFRRQTSHPEIGLDSWVLCQLDNQEVIRRDKQRFTFALPPSPTATLYRTWLCMQCSENEIEFD